MAISTIKGSYPKGTYIFPSSSSDGASHLITESNVRDITSKIVSRNYKVSSSDFTLGQSGNNLTITSGIAIINGYRIYIPNTLTMDVSEILSDADTYNVYLKVAKQTSADTYIADIDNLTTGAIYIEYVKQSEDTAPRTIEEYIKNNDTTSNRLKRTKSAVYRFADVSTPLSGSLYRIEADNISDGYDSTEIVPEIGDSDFTSTLMWSVNRFDDLYTTAWSSLKLKDTIILNSQTDINLNVSMALNIGTVTTDGTTITSYTTYDCTKRIDADDLFGGDINLDEYLASSNSLLRSHGPNTISAIRNADRSLKEIPFISTIDSIQCRKTCDEYDGDESYAVGDIVKHENLVYICIAAATGTWDATKWTQINETYIYNGEFIDSDYTYLPYTYAGNSYDESEDDANDRVDSTKAVIECSYNAIKKDDSDVAYNSQILNVASVSDCYTSYAFNPLKTEFNSDFDYAINPNDYAAYKTSTSYSVGDFCKYRASSSAKYLVYKCINATSGTWKPAHWELQSVDDPFLRTYPQNSKFYVGMSGCDDAMGTSAEEATFPDFGMYSDESHVFIKTDVQTSSADVDDDEEFTGTNNSNVEYLDITSGNVKIYSNASGNTSKFEVGNVDNANSADFNNYDYDGYDNFSPSSTYAIGDRVRYPADTNNLYVCITAVSTAGAWDPTKWNADNTPNSKAGFIISNSKSTLRFKGEVSTASATTVKKQASASVYLDNYIDTNKGVTDITSPTADVDGSTILHFTSNIKADGYVRANRVYNAVYNDYAEWYNSKDAKNIKEGDLIYYNPEEDEYNNHGKAKAVIGVCSENFGYITGGDAREDISSIRDDYIPVSLCGRVPVKVNFDNFECGDMVYADGTNIGTNEGEYTIGKFLKYLDKDLALVQIYLGGR